MDPTVVNAADVLRDGGRVAVAGQLLEVYRDAEADGSDLWFDPTALRNAVSVINERILDSRFPSVVLGPANDGSTHVRYDDDASGEMINLVFQPEGRVWYFMASTDSVKSESVSFEECHALLRAITQSV